MKHIIYITTAMDKNDFNEYLKHWKSSPNPSNQNFHNKMIRSLSINNKVDVISVRPFSRSLTSLKGLKKDERISGNIFWHYISIQRNIFEKIINGQRQINSILKDILSEDSIIFIDTINPALVHFCKHAFKGKNNKIIGICTDSPSNITGTSRSYTVYLLSHTNDYSGYICLTKGLDDLFNPNSKPSVVIEGIVENNTYTPKNGNEKYFFFAGAMLPRYGIYNLIEAFKSFNVNHNEYKLLIAGHHADRNAIAKAIGNNKNIGYLGSLTIDECLEYECGAIANINPRPFSEDLDRYSIPSKTLEYLTSGVPTISVKNSKLQKVFGDNMIWSKTGDVANIEKTMEMVINLSPSERSALADTAKEKVLSLYSLKSVNEKINSFLDKLI
ncbi:MAG: glycosyltransferase [Erysipelotrichaceae bacterium]|nr:glycosyltransferase [Erysipelotrichaceae bacterium]